MNFGIEWLLILIAQYCLECDDILILVVKKFIYLCSRSDDAYDKKNRYYWRHPDSMIIHGCYQSSIENRYNWQVENEIERKRTTTIFEKWSNKTNPESSKKQTIPIKFIHFLFRCVLFVNKSGEVNNCVWSR